MRILSVVMIRCREGVVGLHGVFGVQVDLACSVWCSGGDWDNFFDGHVVLVVLCY